MLVKGMFWNHIPHSILVNDLLAMEAKTLFLKLRMETPMPYKSWTSIECGILDSSTNPYRHFSNCRVLKICDFITQSFLIEVGVFIYLLIYLVTIVISFFNGAVCKSIFAL